MGFGGISVWQLLIVLAILLLLFGTKKLRNIGGDLGGALKGFKKAMSDDSEDAKDPKKLDKEEDAQFSSKVDAAQKETVKDDKKADQ